MTYAFSDFKMSSNETSKLITLLLLLIQPIHSIPSPYTGRTRYPRLPPGATTTIDYDLADFDEFGVDPGKPDTVNIADETYSLAGIDTGIQNNKQTGTDQSDSIVGHTYSSLTTTTDSAITSIEVADEDKNNTQSDGGNYAEDQNEDNEATGNRSQSAAVENANVSVITSVSGSSKNSSVPGNTMDNAGSTRKYDTEQDLSNKDVKASGTVSKSSPQGQSNDTVPDVISTDTTSGTKTYLIASSESSEIDVVSGGGSPYGIESSSTDESGSSSNEHTKAARSADVDSKDMNSEQSNEGSDSTEFGVSNSVSNSVDGDSDVTSSDSNSDSSSSDSSDNSKSSSSDSNSDSSSSDSSGNSKSSSSEESVGSKTASVSSESSEDQSSNQVETESKTSDAGNAMTESTTSNSLKQCFAVPPESSDICVLVRSLRMVCQLKFPKQCVSTGDAIVNHSKASWYSYSSESSTESTSVDAPFGSQSDGISTGVLNANSFSRDSQSSSQSIDNVDMESLSASFETSSSIDEVMNLIKRLCPSLCSIGSIKDTKQTAANRAGESDDDDDDDTDDLNDMDSKDKNDGKDFSDDDYVEAGDSGDSRESKTRNHSLENFNFDESMEHDRDSEESKENNRHVSVELQQPEIAERDSLETSRESKESRGRNSDESRNEEESDNDTSLTTSIESQEISKLESSEGGSSSESK